VSSALVVSRQGLPRQDNSLLCASQVRDPRPAPARLRQRHSRAAWQDKVMVKGSERELNKIKAETNGPQSAHLLNDQSLKLTRQWSSGRHQTKSSR